MKKPETKKVFNAFKLIIPAIHGLTRDEAIRACNAALRVFESKKEHKRKP